MLKIITWVDLEGNYRVTSPAYEWLKKSHGFDEDEAIEYVWAKIVASGGYGIPADHPHFIVEDADQRSRLAECCELYFRYPVQADENGQRWSKDGAWEMDVDGRPKVNMAKARGIHMDCIRECRNAELVKKDLASLRAIEAGDTSTQATIATEKQNLRDIPQTFDLTTDTPVQLKAKWPDGLPTE